MSEVMSVERAMPHLSIGEVLGLLLEEFPDVTISKIRFLESQGLIDPERTPSGYRKFYDADIDRLRWILRQQRENFLPLKVIKDRLDEVPFGHTAWWTFTGSGGDVTMDTAGSDFDTVVGVYVLNGGAFEQVGCVDDVFDPETEEGSLQAAITVTFAGWLFRAYAICSEARTSPPGVWSTRSIGVASSVSRITRSTASESSMSMKR